MPVRKLEFLNGEIYHITMRGVDGRNIFCDDEDRWRGIFGLYEFNNSKAITIREQRNKRKKIKEQIKQASRDRDSVALAKLMDKTDKRNRLVDIIAFTFMPNHLHLLLMQNVNNGVGQFVRKFNVGYAMYFNTRYERKGVLFQGRFNASHIGGNEYFKTVFTYIHTNQVSIIEPGWKENGIMNFGKTIEFLENYRWSSFLDYIGKNNFPSVTERDFGLKLFAGTDKNCSIDGAMAMKNFIDGWLKAKQKITESRSL